MSSSTPSKVKKEPQVPRPSSSVLLISPTNQVLLLHRVKTSSAFPSAHVFPGGNCSTFHDGEIPGPDDAARHVDGEAYRLAAIRETFEESGILLAKNAGFGRLIEVEESERESGRKAIHKGDIPFRQWLAKKGGIPDTENLIPFTRWITPTNVPKRFTTQMYLYFLPLANGKSSIGPLPTQHEAVIPVPTPDGGIEHTAARFLPPSTWLSMARAGEIILFPPQFFLLQLISQFLSPTTTPNVLSPEHLGQQRKQLMGFVKTGEPPWGEKCISPTAVFKRKSDGRAVLGLDKPGPELEGTDRRGVEEWVVFVEFKKEGPRNVEVVGRKEAFEMEREEKREKL